MSATSSQAPPHWFVLGAGSIGCLYAAYLQRAGITAALLLRDQVRLQQFHDAGLTLQIDDIHWPVPIAAQVIDPSAATPRIRHLLLCTKAHHSVAAITAIQAALAADATVGLLQNGMGVREELQPLLPRATFFHALSTEGAWQPQRFHVMHAGRGETVVGEVAADETPGRKTSGNAAATDFAAELHRSGLNARAVADIESRLWQKLAVNCVINPLTALHRCRNGALLDLPDLSPQLTAICGEITAVAGATGIALEAAQLSEKVRDVIRGTAANRSSMLQDIEACRSTEIDYLNGFVVRQARRYGIDAAANAHLLAAVNVQETNTNRQI
ncbi:MAG: 2-dehydropantoate 2-reductase [Spongiibacteraceae bacterium]